MTVSRRYLPASLACLLTLSAGSAGIAAGGSALDPYASVQAPTALKGSKKDEKGKKKFNVPIIKKAQAEEKLVHDDTTQSQTYVKMAGSKNSKKQKEVSFAPEVKEVKVPKKPKAEKAPKIEKAQAAPVPTTTKVSDLAPPKKQKTAAVAGKGDDSVMGGIKTIGEGYSKTFKAASHGVVSSTKAASDAMLAGSKKMTSGIKSGAKASGDVFKRGVDVVGHGFKATGDKIKDGAAPLTNKIAKAPGPAKAPKKAKEEKAPKETKIASEKPKEGGQSFGEKLAHMTPKMPKIGIPFVGGKKKAPVVDKHAGANEQGAQAPAQETNVAAAIKQTPIEQEPKQTPIVDTAQQTAQAPAATAKPKSAGKIKGAGQSLVAMPGNVTKKIGKLWPFGHKENAAAGADVAGKQTQPPM
jgi:hypothetical protein